MFKKHHLAYFCPSKSWGGLEMNQLRNAKWMSERGHKVLLFVQRGSRIHQEAESLQLPVEIVQSHRKYYDFVNARRLSKKIKKHQITHLIVRDPKDMSVCALAKTMSFNIFKAGKLPFFLAYFMEMQIGIPKRDFFHSLRYKKFDLWSCPLPWLKKQVLELTKFPERKTIVIPSGIELEKYLNAPERTLAKQLLDLNIHKEYIGLVGRFDVQKGQLLLLEAFSKIMHETSHNLVFLGEPNQEESDDYFRQLQDFVRKNGLEDRVFFRPFRQDVETFYAAIDVFVMATKSETFGMVTIEALASGCRVVGSNKGGTVEILGATFPAIGQVEFGTLFESGNSADLAEKLMISIGNKDFDAEKVKSASKKYDAHLVCEKVENAIGCK